MIKKEVLDLSDMADKLGGILIAQNSKFETQKKHLDEIAKIIRLFKEHGARPSSCRAIGRKPHEKKEDSCKLTLLRKEEYSLAKSI